MPVTCDFGINWIFKNDNKWELSSKSPIKKKKRLIILIHGIFGDRGTWITSNNEPIPLIEEIFSNVTLENEYDIAVFSYHTKLLQKHFLLRLFLYNARKESFKNNPINRISELLQSQIKGNFGSLAEDDDNYNSIDIICHSMGGLVARKAILYFIQHPINGPSIKNFFALATPNNGAFMANFSKYLFSSYQITDLSVFSEFINQLNHDWFENQAKLPICCYFAGFSDDVVEISSAYGYQSSTRDQIGVEANHSTILHPELTGDQLVVTTIQNRLLNSIVDLDTILLSFPRNIKEVLQRGDLQEFCHKIEKHLEYLENAPTQLFIKAQSTSHRVDNLYNANVDKGLFSAICLGIITFLSEVSAVSFETYDELINFINIKIENL